MPDCGAERRFDAYYENNALSYRKVAETAAFFFLESKK